MHVQGGDPLAWALRRALADVTSMTFRAQAAHWNVTGPDFHQYHEFFGVIYEEVEESIDPLAESLRKMGARAPSSIREQIRASGVDSMPVESSPRSLVKAVFRANEQVLASLHEAVREAEAREEHGLVDLLGGRIDMHKKWGWQLGATLDGFTEYAYPDEAGRAEEALPDGALVLLAAAAEGCPPATGDVVLNLENRKKAIDGAMYGPLNPAEPNDEYWQALADEWSVDADTARRQTCGNCAMFNVSAEMKSCIEAGVTGDRETDAFDAVDAAGELGYCEAFDFKCASARTCRAWVGGGPITASAPADLDAIPEEGSEAADFEQGPCWEGYVQIGMKEVDGKQVPNCVPAGEAAGGHQAPEEWVEGPAEEALREVVEVSEDEGMYAADGEVVLYFGDAAEEELAAAVASHNSRAPRGRAASLSAVRAVYRRGARAMPRVSSAAGTRHEFAMGRVSAYLSLLSSGRPESPYYTSDNDLLPGWHALSAHTDEGPDRAALAELSSSLLPASEYASDDDAVLALTELSGLGYTAEPAIRASWVRAVRSGQDPFNRAAFLASALWSSADADLLPRTERE